MIDDLISIADALDAAGFTKEAAEIDTELEKAKRDLAEQSFVETIPMSKKDNINVDSLIQAFFEVLSDSKYQAQASGIVNILRNTVNTLTNKGVERRSGPAKDTLFLSPQGIVLAKNIANLASDLEILKKQLPLEEDIDEKKRVEYRIREDENKLKTQYKILDEHISKNPNEAEKIYQYIDEKVKDRTSNMKLQVERRMQE